MTRLRGSAGGLPEAGLSVSTVVVTVPIAIHPDPATGAPCWARRAYPSALQQDMDAWQAAVEEVLVSGGPDAYLRRSQECRRTALDHLAAAQHRGIMQPFAVAD